MAEFERDKKFGNLFLAKLKMAITFAPGIRMTIIIYAFGVEKISHTIGVFQNPKISRLLSFFFQVLLSYFSILCLGSLYS